MNRDARAEGLWAALVSRLTVNLCEGASQAQEMWVSRKGFQAAVCGSANFCWLLKSSMKLLERSAWRAAAGYRCRKQAEPLLPALGEMGSLVRLSLFSLGLCVSLSAQGDSHLCYFYLTQTSNNPTNCLTATVVAGVTLTPTEASSPSNMCFVCERLQRKAESQSAKASLWTEQTSSGRCQEVSEERTTGKKQKQKKGKGCQLTQCSAN